MIQDNKQQLITKLKQDVLLRWGIALIEIILILLLWYVSRVTGDVLVETNVFVSLLIILVITGAINFFIQTLMTRKKVSNVVTFISRVLDITVITYIVSFTGSINSLFYVVYILLILIEGMSLNKRQIAFDCVLSIIFYTSLILLKDVGLIIGKTILTYQIVSSLTIRIVFMLLAAWVSISYASILSEQQEQLEKLNERIKDFNQELEKRVTAATKDMIVKSDENVRLYNKYQSLFINMTRVLAKTLDMRDPYASGHADRVTRYALAVMDELSSQPGLKPDPELRGTLYLSGVLHDIGTLAFKDSMIENPSSLSKEEADEMKLHCEIGAKILEPIKELDQVSEIIRHHHERYDGLGYPSGLKGHAIPLCSRIIAIVDTFDALTSERSYRQKMNDADAIREIKNNSNIQFDPDIVKAFLQAYDKGNISNT